MAETETATTMDDENTTTTTTNNNTTTKPDIDVNKKEKYASYPQHQPTRLYLVICNIQKIANIKNMLLASIAFGCSEVLLVGNLQRTKKTTTTKKTKDDDDDDDDDDQIVFTNNKMFPVQFQEAVAKGIINLRHFPKWKQCVHYMNCPNSNRRKIYLIGVEIDEARSQLLDTNYYHQHYPKNETDIGILLGNEGQGILDCFLQHCHALIQIPQYGVGTASMNVNVATSIVLHKFQDYKQRGQLQKKEKKRKP